MRNMIMMLTKIPGVKIEDSEYLSFKESKASTKINITKVMRSEETKVSL